MLSTFIKEKELDIYLYNSGKNFKSYELFGSHFVERSGVRGSEFVLWAPNAKKVEIVGDFNKWIGENHQMIFHESTGIWYLFIPNFNEYELYKYSIYTSTNQVILKSDPFAFFSEIKPNTASITYEIDGYKWNDKKWLSRNRKKNHYKEPMNIYEVNLNSWKFSDDNNYLSYIELAKDLVSYVKNNGYTHVEIMPVMEHPFDGSWGYQVTGYYSITSRYGRPKEFMYLIDEFHKNNIGVILDWVPCHFCNDEHGIRMFDGTKLYEHVDKNISDNEIWGTTNFDYAKNQVKSFLISNAMFFFDKFHIDGLRVDAVAFMLYQGYTTEKSEVNINAVEFLKLMNSEIFSKYPSALMIAEESSAWPNVTKPIHDGGLGFNFKWNMGWMNDMLKYIEMDFDMRKNNHKAITFSIMYAFTENFILPLSHDEVVHGKKSLLDKMPGDYWQKFAGLRMFYGYMYAYPGKKLLFMGGEIGQFIEWNYEREIDWFLKEHEMHSKINLFVSELNSLYKKEKSFSINDDTYKGFEWIDYSNNEQSIVSFIRKGNKDNHIIVISNFTPKVYKKFELGVPTLGMYEEIMNSDYSKYGGSNFSENQNIRTIIKSNHGRNQSIIIDVAPLSTMYLKYKGRKKTND
ncbi:1,4-alpha-glucan branching protein GlgB [Helicovermis profundi]|uniref:1,4-alpha-glucan branching enzyme GlgB n=1 Tax=Helicovermis profundi TaxID=3065157 RepID=A0AAU9EK11_9FIRM|nr:1,4-alpha-glucan branching protein GlgB [Clostridia bacterium S502]